MWWALSIQSNFRGLAHSATQEALKLQQPLPEGILRIVAPPTLR